MHLQQTKDESLSSGGPQYYFHDLPAHVKEFLLKRRACRVVLQTPYGIAASNFIAVDRDHKISNNKVVRGKVGHDRIQTAGGTKSIGEEIRYWYNLPAGKGFETIELDAVIHPAGHFILIPTAVKLRGTKRRITLERMPSPLSFHRDYQSKLWRIHIDACKRQSPTQTTWAASQIAQIVQDHRAASNRYTHEADLLRSAGALATIGAHLSLYLTKGYDCPRSTFHFKPFPAYPCPVEIKKRSSRFNYQMLKYAELPRAVVLCIDHDLVNPPDHVDVLELSTLAQYLGA